MISAGIKPDERSWSARIHAYTSAGRVDEAIELGNKMREEGIPWTVVVYTSVIAGFVQVRDFARWVRSRRVVVGKDMRYRSTPDQGGRAQHVLFRDGRDSPGAPGSNVTGDQSEPTDWYRCSPAWSRGGPNLGRLTSRHLFHGGGRGNC